MKLNNFLLTVFLLFCTSLAMSAPLITSVDGTIKDNETITINGSSFGSHNLDVNFLGGVDGDIAQTANGLTPSDTTVWKYRWSGTTFAPSVSTTESHSNGKSLFVNTDQIARVWWFDYGSNMGSVFVSWWVYMANSGYSGQWKMLRINSTYSISDGFGEVCWFNYLTADGTGNQMHIRPCTEEHATYNVYPGQDCSSPHSYQGASNYLWPDEGIDAGKWMRMDVWFKESDADTWNGGVYMTTTRPDGVSNQVVTDSFDSQMTRTDGTMKRYVFWQNYYNGGGNFYIDDVYVQPGTQARVEIANSSIWTGANHREIQVPTSWAPGEIVFTFNQGSFNNDDTVYLFVVDDSGNINANGFPVTINGSIDATPPAKPTGLDVIE